MKHTYKLFLTHFIILLSLFTLCRDIKFVHAEEEVPEIPESEEVPQYSASFRFTLADGNGTEELPDEVMATLPGTVEGLKDGDRIDAPILDNIQIGNYTFLGWEPPYAVIHGNDVVFSGIWKYEGSSMKLKAPSLKASSELYSGFGSLAWGLKEGTYIGTYNFLLGGRQAYCIEIEKSVPAAGSRYVYVGQDSSKIARIIGKGTANGMSPGAIQATVWNYVAKDKSRAWVTTGESVDYDDSRYLGGNCTIDIYVPDGNYQKFALLKGCETPPQEPRQGSIRIVKKAQDLGFSYLDPSVYSLEGAVYGIYSDQACTNLKSKLTTRSDGSTDKVTVDPGTWYVKEISPSMGFTLDPTVYTAKVSDAADVSVTSVERPKTGSAYVVKKGKDPSCLELYPNNYSLEGAVYGIYLEEDCKNKVGTLTTGINGISETVDLPAGKYYAKEISASLGHRLDETVYPLLVEIEKTTVIESVEEPIWKTFDAVLIKQNGKDESDIQYLEEAEFTLSYYDSRETDLEGSSPSHTWTFSPKIKDGKAIIRFDQNHLICEECVPCDEDGRLILPLGVFAIEETKAPQMYLRDETVYVGKITKDGIEWKDSGQITSMIDEEGMIVWTQKEEKVILKTTAIFEESGTDRYVADGVVHIIDTVEYDCLKPGKEYLLKTRLIRKKDRKVMAEEETKLIPKKENGTIDVPLKCELDEGGDLVVFEYLYEDEDLISCHEDIDDEGQTVHAEELYKASMVLYKIGGSRDIRLNGAVFQITGTRTRRDGTRVDTDYGRAVSGGIWYEQEEPFVFELSNNKNMESAKEYSSSIHPIFARHHVCITGLKDGTWYGRVRGQKDVRKYEIAQGMILIEDVPEDSILTYVEQIAPKGYYLAPDSYIVEVGHDTSLTRIENYRTNHALILPKTGVE